MTPAKPCRDRLVTSGGYVGGLAIRQGPWKLIPATAGPNAKAARPTELYNLADDLAEKTNLAQREPDKVKELTALLTQIGSAGRSRD